jgi:hypothetical protein
MRKGDEKRSLELRINVSRQFIGYPSKAGMLLGYLYTKAYGVSLKGGGGEKRSLELRINSRREFIGYLSRQV